MASVLELVAGDAHDILVSIAAEGTAGVADPRRYDAHLALGGGLDPGWLDLFAAAARGVGDGRAPTCFEAARVEVEGLTDAGERILARVDPAWIDAVARIDDATIDHLAGTWIELLEGRLGVLARDEKPWIRRLAGDIVAFCRVADRSPAVLFAWTT
jgi:hypothetical protein